MASSIDLDISQNELLNINHSAHLVMSGLQLPEDCSRKMQKEQGVHCESMLDKIWQFEQVLRQFWTHL